MTRPRTYVLPISPDDYLQLECGAVIPFLTLPTNEANLRLALVPDENDVIERMEQDYPGLVTIKAVPFAILSE